jgi:excisionase family DNA binding protein
MSSKSKLSPKASNRNRSYELIAEAIREGQISFSSSNNKEIAIPSELMKIIEDSVQALSRGRKVELVDSGLEITTQEAADYLGMSRPTLVQLLLDGKIPYTQSSEGKHRRIQISDLVDYQKRSHKDRADALNRMVETGQAMMSDPDYVELSMEQIISTIKEIRKENAVKPGVTRNS